MRIVGELKSSSSDRLLESEEVKGARIQGLEREKVFCRYDDLLYRLAAWRIFTKGDLCDNC